MTCVASLGTPRRVRERAPSGARLRSRSSSNVARPRARERLARGRRTRAARGRGVRAARARSGTSAAWPPRARERGRRSGASARTLDRRQPARAGPSTTTPSSTKATRSVTSPQKPTSSFHHRHALCARPDDGDDVADDLQIQRRRRASKASARDSPQALPRSRRGSDSAPTTPTAPLLPRGRCRHLDSPVLPTSCRGGTEDPLMDLEHLVRVSGDRIASLIFHRPNVVRRTRSS